MHEALLLKPGQVAANAGRRSANQLRQAVYGAVAVAQENLEDSLSSLICFGRHSDAETGS
jgi:hypothetical protein